MTAIEWTDVTWNPTDGCEVCSPGCANCYAMRFAGRFSKPGERYHGLVTIAKNKRAVWTGDSRLDVGKLAKPLSWKKPRRVFVNSMSDLFYDGFTNEQIAAVFGVMAACPQHTFQVLTKRAKRMREWFAWLDTQRTPLITIPWSPRLKCRAEAGKLLDVRGYHPMLGTEPNPRSWPLPNVWLGVSVENQAAADQRIPDLLATPAAVRFISAEPLLDRVDIAPYLHRGSHRACPSCLYATNRNEMACPNDGTPLGSDVALDWVIAGCESGPGARPCSVEWLRSLRDQCAAAGVPFFLKQAVHSPITYGTFGIRLRNFEDITEGLGSKRKPGGVIGAPYLDGVQHLAMPEVR